MSMENILALEKERDELRHAIVKLAMKRAVDPLSGPFGELVQNLHREIATMREVLETIAMTPQTKRHLRGEIKAAVEQAEKEHEQDIGKVSNSMSVRFETMMNWREILEEWDKIPVAPE